MEPANNLIIKDSTRCRISSAMAERSKHLAERGLSPFNPLDSEVCGGSSYALSFPSQPPDIRNWFSSYEYESPECSGLAQDLQSFLLPAEEGRETQDPLGSSQKKVEVSPAVEDKQLAESPLIIPRGRELHYGVELQHKSCPATEFVPLKENPNSLPEVEGKSSGKHDGSENGDGNLNLSTVDEKLVKGHEQSPKWIPAKTKFREDVSHQQISSEISPIPPKIDADSEVAHEGELFPRCNIGKDGFVSVKNEFNTRVGGGTFPSSLNLKVKHEDQVAGEGRDILGMSSHGNEHCSNRENHRTSAYHESFEENSFLPLKRKQNLQQLFGVGFLTKCSEEENSDLISSKMHRSSVKEQERSLNVLSDMGKCKENFGAKESRRDDRQYSAGRIKEDQISQEECWFLRCTDEELKENVATSSFVSAKNREITNDDIWNSPRKSSSAMNYKDMVLENEMIRRETNEDLVNGDCISLENNGNLEGKGEEAREGTRRPLADKSNFQAGVVAAAPEIPGKWRCPRRSKPYTVPPLKQLRLERWVHRMA